MDYEQKDITIKTKDGPMVVAARVAENGLAYHRTKVAADLPPECAFLADCWTVTHVASGHTLCWETHRFENEQQCQGFIDQVGGMLDWKEDLPKPSMKMKQEIERIAKRCRGLEITTVF